MTPEQLRECPIDQCAENTDREIYRGPDDGCGDFYSDSLHITQEGALGINCGGYVIVRPIRAWHGIAKAHVAALEEIERLAARVGELEKDAERSSKKIDFLRLELFSETTARKSAENELFAAIQDADRYRWLRVQRHADIAACWYLPVMPQDYPVDTPEQRDAAIDAARSKP